MQCEITYGCKKFYSIDLSTVTAENCNTVTNGLAYLVKWLFIEAAFHQTNLVMAHSSNGLFIEYVNILPHSFNE